MGKVDKRIVRSCRFVESGVSLAVMVFQYFVFVRWLGHRWLASLSTITWLASLVGFNGEYGQRGARRGCVSKRRVIMNAYSRLNQTTWIGALAINNTDT
ncbi:hypothetical protein EHLJMEHL_03942 [Vreelandella titanicae]